MKTRLLLLAAAFLLAALAAGRAYASAGAIRVSVVPTVILADGVSTATVSAEVRTSSGRPARDGTEVRFYTTAGNITAVAFTSAGIARATLTAAAVAQAANVSVSVGVDQAITTVPMVSKLIETAVGGRVLRITGKYVAYSEDMRLIQADQQVKLRFRGVEVEANSMQVDLNQNTVKALGKVQVSSDDKTLIGERLWWDLSTFEGYIVAVGTKRWFSGYGLTDLPEKPKNLNPDFDLVDMSSSKLVWVGKQANYVYGERVQVQGARAYVGGIKSLRMPYHEAYLNYAIGQQPQYIGIGSQGLTLDLPFYLKMSPAASTAVRLGYGSRSDGIGYFTRNNGLSVDVVQKYGFHGASEGEAQLINMSSFDRWGFAWTHTQQFGQKTRVVSNLQFPEHRDIYGAINLTTGMPIGTLQASAAMAKPHSGNIANTLSLAFESKPKPLANGKLALSVESSFYRRDAQPLRVSLDGEHVIGPRIKLPASQYESLGLRLRPRSMNLGHGFTLDSSAVLRGVIGTVNTGMGPGFEGNIRRTIGKNGQLSFGLNYNPLTTTSDIFPEGKMNGTFNLTVPVTKKLRIAALGSMAFDSPNQHSILQMTYEFAPKWRMQLLHTIFKFGQFGDYDYQVGIARTLGSRDLGIYWSRREHKFIFEFGAASF